MGKLTRLSSFLGRTSRQPPSPKIVKACPKCGSVNIRLSSKLDAWLTPTRYLCSDCGYMGPVIMEVEESERAEKKGESNPEYPASTAS